MSEFLCEKHDTLIYGESISYMGASKQIDGRICVALNTYAMNQFSGFRMQTSKLGKTHVEQTMSSQKL